MIHTAPGALHLDLNRVKLAIVRGRRKGKTVRVADELRDFPKGEIEFLLVSGEIDTPAPNAGGFLQVTLPKARQSILLPSPLSGKRASDEALRLIRRNPCCEPELPYSAVVVATCVSDDYARAQSIGSPI